MRSLPHITSTYRLGQGNNMGRSAAILQRLIRSLTSATLEVRPAGFNIVPYRTICFAIRLQEFKLSKAYTQNVIFDPCRGHAFNCCNDTFGTPEFRKLETRLGYSATGDYMYFDQEGEQLDSDARYVLLAHEYSAAAASGLPTRVGSRASALQVGVLGRVFIVWHGSYLLGFVCTLWACLGP